MFYITHASLVFIVVFIIVIARFRTKNPLKNHFIVFMIELFVWTFSVIAQQYSMLLGHTQYIVYLDYLSYLGVAFIPVQMLLICMFVTSSGIKSRKGKMLLFVVPVLTQVMVWTNSFHHAFYESFGFMTMDEVEFGWYFYVHSIYSYGCILGAIVLLVRFALRHRGTGDSTAQAVILLIGSVVPVLVNIGFTFGFEGLNVFSTPVAFLITVLLYFYGVYRYNMIRLSPIAMKTVMDKASDLYIVIDENMFILDFNQPFYDVFSTLTVIKREMSLVESLGELNRTGVATERILELIKECRDSRGVIHKDLKLVILDEEKHFSAEFIAFIIENECYGCILLFRDITRAMNDMEVIKQNHIRLVEQEHLAQLGQLMGGITHNLKTPIMAISGRIENLDTLISEYEESAGDENVSAEDHREIAKEMKEETLNIQNHIAYISEVITTVKEQTAGYNEDVLGSFTVEELVRRIRILMDHELIRNNCELIYNEDINDETMIYGDINAFVQIIDNVIINAMHAYEGVHGTIWLTISKIHEDIVFAVKDEAGGIPPDIQDKLFKQMITSKGKDGTGLGLYISNSTVVGRYEGKMWFNTIQGKGSEFFISIPHIRRGERSVRRNESQ